MTHAPDDARVDDGFNNDAYDKPLQGVENIQTVIGCEEAAAHEVDGTHNHPMEPHNHQCPFGNVFYNNRMHVVKQMRDGDDKQNAPQTCSIK